MKSVFFWALVLIVCLPAWSTIQITVCDPEDLRPLGLTEIMLGTQVSLLVASEDDDLWSGGIFIHDEHRGNGILSWRDSDDPADPPGIASILEAAGPGAFIHRWNDSLMSGYDLYTDELDRDTGNWFVLDYTPLAEGDCTLHFYDHQTSWTQADDTFQIALVNTATRDLDDNGVVNLADFALFAAAWGLDNCAAPSWCGGADLNRDGQVDLEDLMMFADFWLWGTPNWVYTPPRLPPEPDIFYALIDVNGLDEVWLEVGQSVQLYIDMTTLDQDVYIFDMEVTLSDTTLGWIDNTEYDGLNPPGTGTAALLFTPRLGLLDYWGPGQTQQEGIQFFAFGFPDPISDGALASFIYTATAAGEVTLGLINHAEGQNSLLLPITLHQYVPQQMMMLPGGQQYEFQSQLTLAEMIAILEELWEDESGLRNTIDQQDWDDFIDAIKASEDYETLE